MTPKWELVSLPRWEMMAYWILSFASHLYSFYQLHRFSKEHEVSLDREVQLERGFFIWGFKKDPTDFEWSFWNEWAWRSLLWSLIGHAVVSRLAAYYLPQFRLAVFAAYGLFSAGWLLGLWGVTLLMLHLSISLVVAQLRSPALSWFCSLLLLSTLNVSALQDLQRGWCTSEDQYYLLLFSTAVCSLRCISFSLEMCWHPLQAGGPNHCSFLQVKGLKTLIFQFYKLTAYCFYHPLFYNGPIMTYRDFSEQIERPVCKVSVVYVLSGILRVFVWWCLAEFMIHFMYMHAIQSNETYLEMLPHWALGGLALALVQFFYVKYLVLFGAVSLLVKLDGLEPPTLPRCVSIMYSFTGMWRHFDVGLYKWLIRYIYVPLGGSRHGVLWKIVSTALAFGFVCFWHGCHDYLLYWALLNWIGVLVENVLALLFSSHPLHHVIVCCLSPRMQRRGLALISAFSTALLILSNLFFLGGIHVGRIFWKRVFVQGWSSVAVPMVAFLYCFAQVGIERDMR
ncbi:protein-cysteine N-palmitoyltransferase HHAT isoform X2 [Megalobrama amblycephala]|uniref:protein-cysteine N-palmitoyltransferase HHAT isoform X2 n=1 Tax=Megalobrama amblycephala TaxID=75352 RepID=UPI002013DCA5|nr:protein-cysteine N-palmitoyltransferase HHAT isoform X2 [Megalobrama amblycephala]XP_048047279.1 protein-cysteine N-palmitoyltransferase HHAT isoform X2 [Megalobrama amblycephala]XP_048047280.1 protein-cysteine N-palmitoyltransferase HHAT isoform X2 [Megalobrama amblycephala]XP_048047281.1 protein-cysteine N-palmitoyltransferase HHAT isoform X2 [Megalobrama amblycephala]